MTDTTELARWLAARDSLRQQRKHLDERIDAVDDHIRATLGDTEQAEAGRWRVSFRTVATTRVDTKKVRAVLEPLGLLDLVQTTTEARVLRVTEVDG